MTMTNGHCGLSEYSASVAVIFFESMADSIAADTL